MSRRPSLFSTVTVPFMVAVLFPAMLNVATGALPQSWQRFVWVAWPVAGVLAVMVIAVEVNRARRPVAYGTGDRGVVVVSPGGQVWNLPTPVATFRFRDVELDRLGRMLADGTTVVVSGLPGVGKSQLAARYAAQHRGAFEVGWWVPAASRLAVVGSLAVLAGRLGVADTDQETAAARAVEALSGAGRWLVVFDNVEAERDLVGLLPSGAGQVIITSRDAGLDRLGTPLPLAVFTDEVAGQFLQARAGDRNAAAARALAAQLGGLPLAVEQAAAYCTSAGVSLAGYLIRYHGNRRLHEQVVQARQRILGEQHPDTLSAMSNLAVVLQAQGALPGARVLHEQVLQARRLVLGEEHPDTLSSMSNLALVLHYQWGLPEARALHEQVLQARLRVLGEQHPDTLSSTSNLAGVLWAQGNLPEARELHKQVLQARQRVLGEEHPDTLSSMKSLAGVLHAQGNLAEADRLHHQVWEVRQRMSGQEVRRPAAGAALPGTLCRAARSTRTAMDRRYPLPESGLDHVTSTALITLI